MEKKESEKSISWLCENCAFYLDAECSGKPNACENYESYDIYLEMLD